jgi:hypothetical protein
MPQCGGDLENCVNKGRLISLALPTLLLLLSASGPAVAKGGSQATAGNGAKDEKSVAPRLATNPGNTKVDNRSAKSNVNPDAGSEGTQDPYAVPLFKDAKPLRPAK